MSFFNLNIKRSYFVFNSLMPFSGGRRACPGDTLSRDRIMVFAAAILQNFGLHCEDLEKGEEKGEKVENVSKASDPRHFQLGLILEPCAFKITALPL